MKEDLYTLEKIGIGFIFGFVIGLIILSYGMLRKVEEFDSKLKEFQEIIQQCNCKHN